MVLAVEVDTTEKITSIWLAGQRQPAPGTCWELWGREDQASHSFL